MEHKGTKTIETERLLLRQFHENDAEAMFRNWESDDKVTEFLRWKTATDIKIAADHILRTRERLNKILAENTGKDISVIAQDTERDNFMTAEEALEYGLIDKILYKRD